MGRLFYDLTGLLHWYAYFRRPAGVQRVIEQVGRSAVIQEAARRDSGPGARVVFVVRLLGSDRALAIDPALLVGLAVHRATTVGHMRSVFAESLRRGTTRGLLREGRYFHLPYLLAGLTRTERRFGVGDASATPQLRAVAPPTEADVWFSPGDLWWQPGYASALAGLKERTGVRILQMVHDLYVFDRPAWSPRGFSRVFARQLRDIAPFADHWLASSAGVADQVADRLRDWALPPRPVTVLPMGWDSFASFSDPGADRATLDALGVGRRPFILFVGTIEPRKNVPALLDAMDALRSTHGDRVPTLVVAGGYGWRARGTRARIRQGERDGHVVWARNLPDAELAALYRSARFTVMPSRGEGWGLAVQESLALGAPCIASTAGATREAGLDLARYVDPERPDELRSAIEAWIVDEAALERARLRIRKTLDSGSLSTWSDAGRLLLGCAFP